MTPTDAELAASFATFGPEVPADEVPALVRAGRTVWSFRYRDLDPGDFTTIGVDDLWAWEGDHDDHDGSPETVASWAPFRRPPLGASVATVVLADRLAPVAVELTDGADIAALHAAVLAVESEDAETIDDRGLQRIDDLYRAACRVVGLVPIADRAPKRPTVAAELAALLSGLVFEPGRPWLSSGEIARGGAAVIASALRWECSSCRPDVGWAKSAHAERDEAGMVSFHVTCGHCGSPHDYDMNGERIDE